jgi:hypothetical protein
MADIIDLASRFKPGSNLIVSRPLEFRKAEWLSGAAVLCTREDSERLEELRQKQARGSDRHFISLVPNHFTLEGGCHFTALHLLRFRKDEEAMRRVYRLAGLMECITKAPSPILRTDLVRKFFKLIVEEREHLDVSWKGHVRSFLLPLHPQYYDQRLFMHSIQSAESLKELLSLIETEAGRQFDILAGQYVFYVPESFLALA